MKKIFGILFISAVFLVSGNADDKVTKKGVEKEVVTKVSTPIVLEEDCVTCKEDDEVKVVVEKCNHETKTVVYKSACEGSCGFPVSVRKNKINCSKGSI